MMLGRPHSGQWHILTGDVFCCAWVDDDIGQNGYHSRCPYLFYFFIYFMLLDVSDTLICNNRTNLYIGCNRYIYPKVHLQNWKQIHWDYFDTGYARKCYVCYGSKEKLLFHKWSDSIVVLKAKNMANMCQIVSFFCKKISRDTPQTSICDANLY